MATIASHTPHLAKESMYKKERPLALLRREYVSAFGIRRNPSTIKGDETAHVHTQDIAATRKAYA